MNFIDLHKRDPHEMSREELAYYLIHAISVYQDHKYTLGNSWADRDYEIFHSKLVHYTDMITKEIYHTYTPNLKITKTKHA